jgi:hypothetical protein
MVTTMMTRLAMVMSLVSILGSASAFAKSTKEFESLRKSAAQADQKNVFDCGLMAIEGKRQVKSADWEKVIAATLKAAAYDQEMDLFSAKGLSLSDSGAVHARLIEVLKERNDGQDGQDYPTGPEGVQYSKRDGREKATGLKLGSLLDQVVVSAKRSGRPDVFISVEARLGGSDGVSPFLAIADSKSGDLLLIGMSSADNGCVLARD